MLHDFVGSLSIIGGEISYAKTKTAHTKGMSLF